MQKGFGVVEKTDNTLNMSALIETDLEGKIDNLSDFKSEALIPVFEAIVNSIQAIEDLQSKDRGKITVKVIREKGIQKPLFAEMEKKEEPKIKGFEIQDDGIGFDNNNYKSFGISDSTYKKKRGCKGLGRFFWLKAFDKIEVESVYSENGTKKLRRFEFTKDKGIYPKEDNVISVLDTTPQKTIIRLLGFKENYRKKPSAYKTTEKIAQRILEYFLSYYIEESAPSITVIDDAITISLDVLYNNDIKSYTKKETIEVGGEQFTICHIKLYHTYNNMHRIVFCADHRDVKSDKIKQILGTSAFLDGVKPFHYAAYVSGNYLDVNVDGGRTSFKIPEAIDDQESLNDDVVSLSKIRDKVIEQTKIQLSQYIEEVKAQKRIIFLDFVSKNPMLRHVMPHCPNVLDEIDLDSPPEKINEVLYKNKGSAEWEIQRNAQNLLKTQLNSLDEIQDRYNELTQKIDDFNTDNLAGYLIWRKLIIDLLEKKIRLNNQEQYEKEAIIHDIVFPRKTISDQISSKNLNLWIIDEQLTFHQFAASDKELCQISSSDSDLRPDIFICTESDENQNARSVSIVEFKRPQRKYFDQDPVSEMYKIIRKIKDEKVNTAATGRPILIDEATKFYCYAICDINKEIRTYAENNIWVKLKDNLGYYQFNPSLNSYTEILSFDEILSDVKRRHKIFFEKLGIPQQI